MIKIEEVRAALADRRVDVVASATGLHRNTIAAIRDGKSANPRYSVIVALAKYLGIEA